jgi:DNA replication protein DnaC
MRSEQTGGDAQSSAGRRCRETYALVLDDLGRGTITEWYWQAVEEIIRHRHLRMARTLVTTQLPPELLRETNGALYRRLVEDHEPLEL